MRELSPQRRKLAGVCAAVAAMSGGPVLLKGRPVLLGIWVGMMVVAVAYVITQLAKLKRQGL